MFENIDDNGYVIGSVDENTTVIKQAPRIFDYADQTSQRLKKNTYTTRK